MAFPTRRALTRQTAQSVPACRGAAGVGVPRPFIAALNSPYRVPEAELIVARFVSRYNSNVPRSFRHRGLKRLFERGDKSKLRADQVERIEEILARLDAAVGAKDLNTPGYRLHPLKGDMQGFWSVRVSANERIVFRFEAGDACDVDLTDYH